MQDWNGHWGQLAARGGELTDISPDTLRGNQVLPAASRKAARQEPKIVELIIVAIALNAGSAMLYLARALDAVTATQSVQPPL